MPDFNNNFYSDTRELLSYINGFLQTLELLNFFANNVTTLYVQEIERFDNYETSIVKHLNENNYEVTFREVANWKNELEKTATKFFKSFYHELGLDNRNLQDTINMTHVLNRYIDLMSKLVTDGSKFFEVYVDNSKGTFYECEYNDFLIDNTNGLFFVHFGVSD